MAYTFFSKMTNYLVLIVYNTEEGDWHVIETICS